MGKTERHVHKGSHCGSKQQWRSCATFTLLFLVHARYTWVLFFVHIPFVVNCTFNATPTERLQQISLLFTTNRTDFMFFLWKLHLARPSHPSHSTILLWSQSPCGKCAKLHSVAASNNRYHTPRSLTSQFIASFFLLIFESFWKYFLTQHFKVLCLLVAQPKIPK